MERGAYAAGLFVLVLPVVSYTAWRQWRGEYTSQSRLPDWWARGLPVSVILGWPFFGLAIPLQILDSGPLRTLIAVAEGAVLVAALVLLPSVFLYGRPRSLVPPHLRGTVGTPEQWDSRGRPQVARDRGADEPATVVEAREGQARQFYRDPVALAIKVVALSAFLAIAGFMYAVDVTSVLATSVIVVVTLVALVSAVRDGVSADREGITVRYAFKRALRLPWSEIDRFELRRGPGDLPHACAVLRDGRVAALDPLEGVDALPKRRRWEFAELAIAGLNAQLRAARR